MKRVILTAAVAATLLGGCAQNGKDSGKPAAPAAGADAKTTSPAYFEIPNEKETYVFGSKESMQSYFQEKKLPKMTTHYSKGHPVQVEDEYSARLIKEYESQHK